MKRSSKNVQDPCHSAPVLAGNGSSNSNIHIIPHHSTSINVPSLFLPELGCTSSWPQPFDLWMCGVWFSHERQFHIWSLACSHPRCASLPHVPPLPETDVDTSTQAVLNRGTQQEMTMTTTTTNKTTETTTTKRQQATTTQQPTTAEGPNPQATNWLLIYYHLRAAQALLRPLQTQGKLRNDSLALWMLRNAA